jgi:modulator of FtsH protease
LTGLIFVGVSINLSKIIAFGNMTGRAFQALMLLVAVLVISSLALVPGQSGQSLWLFGVEILLVSIVTLAFILPSQLRATRTVEARFRASFR